MRRNWIDGLVSARGKLAFIMCALTMTSAANAQAQAGEGHWRFGAATGAYIPFSSLIKAADSNDTRLGAGPAFSLEPQYLASGSVSVYLNAMLAVGSIRLG
ncbi:MAG TPA: hypothetical protein VK864_16320, partial [Longimicrobiales bacterium]|nr:hypothetical protein [Longimicrobiales bacterium]